MNGFLAAMALVRGASELITSVSQVIEKAQAEGRDLTVEELDLVRSQRDAVNDEFQDRLDHL